MSHHPPPGEQKVNIRGINGTKGARPQGVLPAAITRTKPEHSSRCDIFVTRAPEKNRCKMTTVQKKSEAG